MFKYKRRIVCNFAAAQAKAAAEAQAKKLQEQLEAERAAKIKKLEAEKKSAHQGKKCDSIVTSCCFFFFFNDNSCYFNSI